MRHPWLVTTLLLTACGPELPLDDEGAVDALSVDAAAILAFVNSEAATVDRLDFEVGLNGKVARLIWLHVRGEDNVLGTSDDDPFDTIAELDAVPSLGPSALRTLDAYVKTLPAVLPAGVTVEGVAFAANVARDALICANSLPEARLADEVGLGARAARSIVAARPHDSLEHVGLAPYIGPVALQRLASYASTQPVPSFELPRITAMSVSLESDVDPVLGRRVDGAHVVFTTENASDCELAAIERTTQAVLETRAGVATRGEVFFGGFAPGNVDIRLRCTNLIGGVERLERLRAVGPTPPPAGACDASGGAYDGVSFSREEECGAVAFMNRARWSQMGALSDTARRVAYETGPDGVYGFRRSLWTNVASFASLPGVGATAVQSLKAAAPGWTEDQDGRFDTVALTWKNRARLDGAPISLDRVYVTKRTVSFEWPSKPLSCVELRDAPGAANYLEACLYFINADGAPGCAGSRLTTCIDGSVGQYVRVRGSLSVSGNRVSLRMHTDGPTLARPNLD